MNWAQVIFVSSIFLTVICVILFLLIPGFPLFIFLFFPPIFCWSQNQYSGRTRSWVSQCPSCGKVLLEPDEAYCPTCGRRIKAVVNENAG